MTLPLILAPLVPAIAGILNSLPVWIFIALIILFMTGLVAIPAVLLTMNLAPVIAILIGVFLYLRPELQKNQYIFMTLVAIAAFLLTGYLDISLLSITGGHL